MVTGEDPPVSQVAIPRLQGSTLFHWVPLQDQVLPPEMEGAPMVLAALAKADLGHWNIKNDPIYPACLDLFKARHKASMALKVVPSMGEGAEDVTHIPELFPTMTQPTTTWPTALPLTVQEVDVWVVEVLDRVHDLNLRWIQEMGFIREIDHALSKSLIVEFLHLQILMGEDLSAALWAWQVEMEVATDSLLRDLGATTQVSITLPSQSAAVETALRQFRAAVQLKMALPLTQLDEARERMEGYIRSHLREMLSQQETKSLIGELSSWIADHRGKVRQLLCSEPLRHPGVAPLVLVGLAAERPIESNFFPGLLEGLLGSLGIAAAGESNPPLSSREGAGRAWSMAVGVAISRIEQKDVKVLETVRLPHGLDPVSHEDLRERRRDLLPPPLADPLFIPNMARAVFEAVRPPVVPEASPLADARATVPAPVVPKGRNTGQEALKPKEHAPSTLQPSPWAREQGSNASDVDSGATEEIVSEEASSSRSLQVRIPLGLLKRSRETSGSGSKSEATPSKVQKGPEAKEGEIGGQTGPSEADLSEAHFELYQKDHPESETSRPGCSNWTIEMTLPERS